MTASSIGSTAPSYSTGVSLLSVLAETAATATQTAQTLQMNEINQQIQKRLGQQIAALQNAPDPTITNVYQAELTTLGKQSSALASAQKQYGANQALLTDLALQLANLQTEAQNGDAANFDKSLAAANTDVSDLGFVLPVAPYQPDGVPALKGNGLGISGSAVYIAGPGGLAAAATDITNAQNLVGQISAATGINLSIGRAQQTAVTSEINSANAALQQIQTTTDNSTSAQIQQLTAQAQNQEHLNELELGNTELLSYALAAASQPVQPAGSVFSVLETAVGATPSTYASQQSTPAILSLLA
jgi:hypothetical protein